VSQVRVEEVEDALVEAKLQLRPPAIGTRYARPESVTSTDVPSREAAKEVNPRVDTRIRSRRAAASAGTERSTRRR
jgi:hypothetical protein